MAIDIEAKSKELKKIVSKYDSHLFIGEIASMMNFISFENPNNSLKGLSSPERQLLYLCGLNITSEINEKEPLISQFSDEEWAKMKQLLIEIEDGYVELFYPTLEDNIDDEWINRRRVAMPAFLSYFNQGTLNYEEQDIERITDYYSLYDSIIIEHFKLRVQDFIDIYNFIDSFPNTYYEEKINKKPGQQSWEEWCNETQDKKVMPWHWQKHLPEHFQNQFEYVYDKGGTHRFSKKRIIEKFGEDKALSFLDIFSVERQPSNFLFYTDPNIIYQKPIFRIDDDTYQAISMHRIVKAIYLTLHGFCQSKKGEKYFKNRGNKLEDKVEKVFQKFFGNKAHVHKGYFVQQGHEQDLLFLLNGNAFIVEAKAAKKDEPRRNPDKAYEIVTRNFNGIIQDGYDQTYRVKKKFINREPLKIYKNDNLTEHVIDIRTKNYTNVFSIVVTLERFGSLQNDLSELLEVWDDDNYPWSICIDDLEVFLLTLSKLNKKLPDLVQYLKFREKVHGRLYCGDELELCGLFLNDRIRPQLVKTEKTIATKPDYANIFDYYYEKKGLGFENEKNMDIKTSGKYITLGGL